MKILGSDYDGTLNWGGVTPAKLAAIEKWQKAGNKFGIVSGRGNDFGKELLRQYPTLKFDFFAGCNGGYIMSANGSILYEARCADVSVLDLAADLFAWGCPYIHVNGAQYVCAVEKLENGPTYVEESKICLIEKLPTYHYFNQVSVQLESVEQSAAMVQKIQEKYGKWLNPLQNGICIDIVPVGVDKAQGMYRVMEFFGGKYDDVITVGDNVNDIDMIREFRSYAMRNGVAKVKDLAFGIVNDVTEIFEKEC